MELDNAITILTFLRNSDVRLKSVEINKVDMWLTATDKLNYECMLDVLNKLNLSTHIRSPIKLDVNIYLKESLPYGGGYE